MGEEDVGESLCGKCNQEIQGQAMKAKDTLYHAEGCFICQVRLILFSRKKGDFGLWALHLVKGRGKYFFT